MAGTQAAPGRHARHDAGCVTESGHVAPMGPRCVTPVLLEARTRRRARSAAVSTPVSIFGGRFATFFLTTFFFFLTVLRAAASSGTSAPAARRMSDASYWRRCGGNGGGSSPSSCGGGDSA